MSALYRIVYSLKNSKFNKKINEFFNVLSTQKISIASISFDIAYKELKIVEIAHINQLFLHSDASVGKSYAKEEKFQQWRQQRFSFWRTWQPSSFIQYMTYIMLYQLS